MKILTDTHIHSHFSPDSKASVLDYCRAAINKGFGRVCITDHVEFNPKDWGYGFYNPTGYFAEIEEARIAYGHQLEIISGCEIGGGPYNYPTEYEEYLAMPYDFILCSVHDWYDGLFASDMVKLDMPPEESFALYWDEVYKTVTYGGFDALAHIDFPKRYYGSIIYDWGKLGQIFDVMINREMALEVNTSTVGSIGEPMPGRELLDFYKKCGGRYLTIGSDAHDVSNLGIDFAVAEELAQGFEVVYYQNRKRYFA